MITWIDGETLYEQVEAAKYSVSCSEPYEDIVTGYDPSRFAKSFIANYGNKYQIHTCLLGNAVVGFVTNLDENKENYENTKDFTVISKVPYDTFIAIFKYDTVEEAKLALEHHINKWVSRFNFPTKNRNNLHFSPVFGKTRWDLTNEPVGGIGSYCSGGWWVPMDTTIFNQFYGAERVFDKKNYRYRFANGIKFELSNTIHIDCLSENHWKVRCILIYGSWCNFDFSVPVSTVEEAKELAQKSVNDWLTIAGLLL